MTETNKASLLYNAYRPVLIFCIVILLIQVAASLSSFSLTGPTGQANWAWGIHPRSLSGLTGILTAPFIHGSMLHVVQNVFALIILGGILALTAPHKIWPVTLFIIVIGGLGVWLFGRDSSHVGASGIIFGWIGYLLLRGLIDFNPLSIIGSLVVGFYFGASLLGIFNVADEVSWEGHLFSAMAGIGAAFLFRENRRQETP